MNPLDFPLLADENIAPELVARARERRVDVWTLDDLGLSGAADADILSRAYDRAAVDVNPPFLIVLERKQSRVLIRLRHEL